MLWYIVYVYIEKGIIPKLVRKRFGSRDFLHPLDLQDTTETTETSTRDFCTLVKGLIGICIDSGGPTCVHAASAWNQGRILVDRDAGKSTDTTDRFKYQ